MSIDNSNDITVGDNCQSRALNRIKEELIEGCVDSKERGFTAVGQLTPYSHFVSAYWPST